MTAQGSSTNIESVVDAEVVEIDEELCSRSIQYFKEGMEDLFEEGKRLFVLDFSKVKIVDSKGLETLLWAIEEVQERGGLIKIACLGVTVKKVFEITQFDRIFEIHIDVISAMKALG